MQEYRVETTISSDGTLIIQKLPFKADDKVEVIVHRHEQEQEHGMRYPLRGKLIRYTDPFGSVAENEWNSLQ
jgi:negative regulator of genetic competence, sporulation and motility